jgi:hypothetical protein
MNTTCIVKAPRRIIDAFKLVSSSARANLNEDEYLNAHLSAAIDRQP